MRKPNISVAEVLTTSTALIEKNGQTTTNEVKTKLREDGYWVKQAEVSKHMRELSEEGKLQSTNDSGREYQIYTKVKESKSFGQSIASFFGFGN